MNVNQVKNVIKKTSCADHVFSGLFCSEPIMSKDEEGQMVDNYLVYSRSDDCSQISSPQCIFGIISEKEETAYINASIANEFKKTQYAEEFDDEDEMRKARMVYLDLFPTVRDMYQFENNIDSCIVQQYIDALKKISGNTLFRFYKKLFPAFFDWTSTL